jgi:outer membrane immunogenic protein
MDQGVFQPVAVEDLATRTAHLCAISATARNKTVWCGRLIFLLGQHTCLILRESLTLKLGAKVRISIKAIAINIITAGTIAASAASAADMAVKAAPIPVAAPFSWTGFYIGGNVGYGWAHDDVTAFVRTTGALFTTFDFNQSGIIGGGQVGYNWQVAPDWLIGIEADFSGADVSGAFDVTRAPGTATLNGTMDEFGTVRGRVGFVANNWLFYGTGGWAWAHIKARNVQTACFVVGCTLGATDLISQDRNGWTAGVGVEYAISRNWSAKLEYLHADFGSYRTVLNAVNRFDDDTLRMDLVRLGFNYRF